MSDRPTLLLEHHLKELKLPTIRTTCSGCRNWNS